MGLFGILCLMMKNLIQTLRQWRGEQARLEGVEQYRVLPNATLEEIARVLPKTKEELLGVKGIKEAKFGKYGKMILKIINEHTSSSSIFQGEGREGLESEMKTSPQSPPLKGGEEEISNTPYPIPDTLSVSQFLDALNMELSGMAARVRGEVSSVDERDRVVYFTIKDGEDGSTLNCLMFRYQYQVSGIRLSVGDEIIVEGVPEMYKPNGRLSLKVGVIEYAGEGALKKAYDELLRKLETEGLLAPERKRKLSEFPERIALITSREGAAIGDFTMNLGMLGLSVDFYPTSVEGKKAVFEILEALKFFSQTPEKYDLLVITRGGGSLESLQAFNNETLVREVANSKIPTLLGIGHEKDITLAALVADSMVSTPTATARTIREPFERARQEVRHAEIILAERFERELLNVRHTFSRSQEILSLAFPKLKERFVRAEESLLRSFEHIRFSLKSSAERIGEFEKNMVSCFETAREKYYESILRMEEKLREYDPNRALSLGYSLVRSGGKLIRSVKQAKKGDTIEIQVSDGTIGAEIREII